MRRHSPFAILIALFAMAGVRAQASELRELKLLEGETSTRAVLDLTGSTGYKLFALQNPERLVLDLNGAALAPGFRMPAPNGVVAGVRTGRPSPDALRVVFDLGKGVDSESHLERDGTHVRLIVELLSRGASRSLASVPDRASSVVAQETAAPTMPAAVGAMVAASDNSAANSVADASATNARMYEPTPLPPRNAAKTMADVLGSGQRELVVAIDAGHGGKDPGAHGPTGVQEKKVTLAVARELARQIDADPGMKAVLIRDGDVFVPLENRFMKARAAQADLFISIHADAAPSQAASGASVFVLSTRGASSQAARWLADKENAADLVGGVSLDDKDRNLSAVLLDLSQSATMRASDDVAGQVLSSLKNVGKAHKADLERANFVVLRSPDVPSMLVETGFITNPGEEQKLDDAGYRSRLANAIASGVRQYFTDQPPPGTWYAARQDDLRFGEQQHVVGRGETLSLIAARHGIDVASLRVANRKRDDSVRVGERLTIPAPATVASAPK